MPTSCPHTARGRLASHDLQFSLGMPGQCDCAFGSSAPTQQQAWLQDVQSRPAVLGDYLALVYESPGLRSAHVDASKVGFFWADAPMLGHNFRVWWACVHCQFGSEVLWAPLQDAVLDPCSGYGPPLPFPGFFVQRPFVVDILLTGISDHTWVEVMRIARKDEKTDAADASNRGQVWLWLAVGSGIWWNVGKSHRLLAADDRYLGSGHPSCAEVRAMGYDSIQLTEFYPAMTLELIDCRGALLEDAADPWEQACPPHHVKLRAGIPPEPRYSPALEGVGASSRRCVCNPATSHIDCLPGSPAPPSTPPPAPLIIPPSAPLRSSPLWPTQATPPQPRDTTHEKLGASHSLASVSSRPINTVQAVAFALAMAVLAALLLASGARWCIRSSARSSSRRVARSADARKAATKAAACQARLVCCERATTFARLEDSHTSPQAELELAQQVEERHVHGVEKATVSNVAGQTSRGEGSEHAKTAAMCTDWD